MRFLHLIPNEKFTEPYIEFVNNNFEVSDHLFLILGKGIGAEITLRNNVKTINKDFKSLVLLVQNMYKSKKIYLHGLFYPSIVLMLFLQPWLLKKNYWIIWGGDLYGYNREKKKIKSKLYESVRKVVIKNLGGVITHIKGDYELAQKWYGAKGNYYYSFMYPSNLFKDYPLTKMEKEKNKYYIQIGNSADPSNNHIEIFDKLRAYKNENIEIICPLSYGNLQYRNEVIKKGNEIFGDKFNPIMDFLPLEEYLLQLSKIDIAIFNHKRQQAIGNITSLLGFGKKVYIRDDITTWNFCADHELTVFNTNNQFKDLFEMDTSAQLKNIRNIKKYFSEEKLKEQWARIFEV